MITDRRGDLRVILSEVPLGYADKAVVVGWDTCGSCSKHVARCACADGPTEPTYVRAWRPSEEPVPAAPKPATPVQQKPTPKQVAERIASGLRGIFPDRIERTRPEDIFGPIDPDHHERGQWR